MKTNIDENGKNTKTIHCPMCTMCHTKACLAPDTKNPPKFCAMQQEQDMLQLVKQKYLEQPELQKLALASARTESSGYMQRTRIEDIMDFAKRIDATKIGIAHCNALSEEARIAMEIFSAHGFDIYSVTCKVGAVPKEEIGLADSEKVRPGNYEAICNPIAQAELLNKNKTHLNVLIGLCVGHDSLFFMHSKAPVTVLVVKDRVLGHNPAAALYTAHSFYKRLKG